MRRIDGLVRLTVSEEIDGSLLHSYLQQYVLLYLSPARLMNMLMIMLMIMQTTC